MGKTSSAVKRRYNNKTYGTIKVMIKKDLVEQFKTKCKEDNVSQAEIVRNAVIEFLKRGD